MTEARTVVERLRWFRDFTQNPPNPELMEVHYGLTTLIRQLEEVKEDAAPDCAHCGSPFTYIRGSDGDIACYDCPGIMPVDELNDFIGSQCPECDGYLVFHPPEFEEENQGEMTEDIECENCRPDSYNDGSSRKQSTQKHRRCGRVRNLPPHFQW